MKKASALIMFTLLATVGYFIGNAVAKSKMSTDRNASDGVLVVEETYGVAVPVQGNMSAAAQNNGSSSVDVNAGKTTHADKAASAVPMVDSKAPTDGDDVMVVETVNEEGYVDE